MSEEHTSQVGSVSASASLVEQVHQISDGLRAPRRDHARDLRGERCPGAFHALSTTTSKPLRCNAHCLQ